ncbi:MAG: PAS domain S-box protein [Candidatus Methanoperedens sp.]|nr:PAS domain S-box protein [Candidatus Methanoperedens sp.]
MEGEKRKLKALSDIASIDLTLEFNEILQRILKITCEAMIAHSGTLILVDGEAEDLRMVASYGLGQDYPDRVHEMARKAGVPLSYSPSGTVLRTGKYYIVPNVFKEPRGKPWLNLTKELGFSSIIFTPMKKGSEIIGLLNVYMAQPHQFTDEEIDFITIAASQAASVVQNAMMCSRLKDNILELKGYKEHLEEKIEEAHKKLYDSEKYLRTVIESSLDGIAVMDEQGRFEFGNDSFFRIIGWQKEEMIGASLEKIVPGEAKESAHERWTDIKDGNERYNEIKIKTRNGEIKYLHISYSQTDIRGEKKIVCIVKDATENKSLELALKESEARYRDLFENANDSLYVYDGSGYFKEVNNTALQLLGCTKDEIIGTHISGWITPESLMTTQENLKKQADGELLEEPMVLEVICKNGEHRWMEIKRRIIKHGNKVKEVHGIGRDTTEKRRLEQELIESETKYRDLFENADDPMYTIDAGGYFKTINNAGQRILGGSRDEIIGSHISRWLTPESYKASQEILEKQVMGVQSEQPILVEVICMNGEHRWGEIRTRVIRDKDRITGIHGIARDITEKKRLEAELIESEARYRDLFEKAEDPMYTIDAGGYFLSINNAGLRLFGCTKEELIGTHISRWITPESLKSGNENFSKLASGERIESPPVYEIICKNGEHRWVETRVRTIKNGDKITGVHGIARDITEKMRLEQQLKEYHEKLKRSYEELIEADRLRTEFVSNITHELLTPLTSIRGFTELLYDETTGKISSEQKKNLEIILRNSDRLIQLIKDLLDISRLEKNKFGLQFGQVSVEDVLLKSAQDVQPQAKYKEIAIVQDIEPLPRVWGDEGRLIQVITNLLSNAIKFTPQEGTITIAARENKSEIKISITDTGIGIPADRLSRIFDRFYQIDGSSSRKYGGMGLGLSICKSIVESHYGTIWAESDGSGSTFHVVLPKLENGKKPGS